MASRLLTRVAEEGTFGTDPRRLMLISNAIMVAGDFVQVSYCLGDERVERIAEDLVRSLKGSLEEQDGQTPYDYQAQLWFGSVLARAEMNTTVPPKKVNRGHPDFAINVDGLHCGVEVKRPQTTAGASGLISTAADQLWDYGRPGIIAVDISQCLNVRDLIVALLDADIAGAMYLSDHFKHVTEQLAQRVRDGQGAKYQRIIEMVVYCRFPHWRNFNEKRIPRFSVMFCTPIFRDAFGGRLINQAHGIRRRLASALTQWLGAPIYSGRELI